MKKILSFQEGKPSTAFEQDPSHSLFPEGDETMKIKHTHPAFRSKEARQESLVDIHRFCLASLKGGPVQSRKKERSA